MSFYKMSSKKKEGVPSKDLIKKIMKEILVEDQELSLNKETTNKIAKLEKELKECSKKPFKDLVLGSSLDIPVIHDWDFQEYNAINVIEDLDNNEQKVQEYIKLKKEYPDINKHDFDIESYYLKKEHLDQLRLLISTIEEFKVKIDLILMGRSIH